MHTPKRLLLLLMLFVLVAPLSAQTPAMRARIDSLITALNGTPEEYEKYAQEAFAPALLDRATPERRKNFVQRVRGDFGKLEASTIRRVDPTTVSIAVQGSTGTKGTLTFQHEAAEPHKLTDLRFTLGEGDGDEPALPPVPVNSRMSAEELSTAIDGYVAKLVSEGKFSGGVLVARDGKPLFEKAWGLANRSDSVPNTTKTRFNIGSINKHFTRVAIGQLAAAGKLSMDDTIGKLLPDYPNAAAHKATVQQLLDMKGGLADFFSPEFREAPKDRFRSNRDYYTFTAPKQLRFEPGTSKEYCNSCFIVLGEMVERLSGMAYEKYVEQNVLQRAGMNDTGFFATDDIVPNVAIGYTSRGGRTRSNVLQRGASGSAAGSAFATLRDLLALDESLRNGKLLDPKWTAWFYGDNEPLTGRATSAESYAGGSGGVNAAVSSNGTWTVVTTANIDPPAAEALSSAIFRALAGGK